MDYPQPAYPRTRKPFRSQHGQHNAMAVAAVWLRKQVCLVLLLLVVFSGLLGAFSRGASTFFVPTASAHGIGTPPKHATINPPINTQSVTHPGFGKSTPGKGPVGPPQSLKRGGGISMIPGTLMLDSARAVTFKGSDSRLEIDVPQGATTSADVAAAGGRIGLTISQVAPASGSSAGGSGIVSFGAYLVQAVDAHGVLLTHGLRKPITIKLHYSSHEAALDLSHALVAFNGTLPDGTTLAPLSTPAQLQGPGHGAGQAGDGGSAITPTMANSRFNPRGTQRATLDTANNTLAVVYTLKAPSGTMTFNTDTAVASFGSPDPFNVDLNAGSLTSTYALDVPAGPGGLTPPVQLTYSSASVSEQHNPQAAAGWVGEGWNLDLGAISWAEHNSNSTCTSGCDNGYEDTWDLSDPFGTSVELIPPNINVATYFDHSPNSQSASPIQWHTTPDNYAKIYSYATSMLLPDGYKNGSPVYPPCFRVFLANGIMEEFGCTSDSLEYYYVPDNGDFLASWHLDLITDRRGNQIHVTYTQDVAQKSGHSYIRDTVLHTIEWDSPGCDNAQTMCTGSSWAPLARVNFSAGHLPTRLTNTPSGCNSGTNLRCDDPTDISGGLNAPDVQSTFALNDAQVQVRTSGTGSWSLLRDYQFSYQQDGPVTHGDAVTGEQKSTAGYFLLSNLVEVGTDNATALPTRSFTYSLLTGYYEDDVYHPHDPTYCGQTWNTGNGSGCLLWNQTYNGNSYYMATADNGMGLHQLFSWGVGRDNAHGTGAGPSADLDPLYCNAHQSGYPCNEADDQNWSHVILTQQEDDVKQASSGNPTIKSISQYAYKLTSLSAWECADCKTGMYWGNQNDGDYLDYYNAKFMGFSEADVSNPDGSVVNHHYLSTEGYGLYDATVPCLAFSQVCYVAPWWDLGNAAHGHEYETDYYDIDGTWLKKATAQYSAACPPSGVSASPSWSTTLNSSPYTYTWDGNQVAELDHGNPVVVCDIQTVETDSFILDGANDSYTVPHSSTSYVYDSLGRVTYQTTGVDTGLKAEYYNDTILSSLKFRRLDATVNNSWGTVSPFPWLPPNSFSIRWTGYVQPQYTGTYTFYTNSDDGVRLWVNGTQLVNNWTNHSPTEDSGTIPLTAGQRYPITLEYYEATGSATMQLSWSEASQPKQIIPATALFTRAAGGGGTAVGSVPATVVHTDYIQNDAVTATSTSATGTYLLDVPADSVTQNGANSDHFSCGYSGYDGNGWATGQQSGLVFGEVTTQDAYTSCAPSGNSGLIRSLYSYDTYGNRLTAIDPDANAGDYSHRGCTSGSTIYSACQAFDTTRATLPTSSSNAFNQTVTTDYGTPAAGNGFGLWPVSVTDANGNTSSATYDVLGRTTSTTLPGETAGLRTTSASYTVWCSSTGAQTPCVEVDHTQRLDSGTAVTARSFYDGFGRLVETRTAAPGGKDVVQFAQYDAAGRQVRQSVPYYVTAYTGSPGSAAFATPDIAQAQAKLSYAVLRSMTTYDALGDSSTATVSVVCNPTNLNDTACYEQTLTLDARSQQAATLTDGLGRTTYSQRYYNNNGVYQVYSTVAATYDAVGNETAITQPDGSATSFSYDDAGRQLSMTDPDRGHESYLYDADGNITKATDARGQNIYAGYDGLDRQVWRNSSNTQTGASVSYSYDNTSNNGGTNQGIGRLTGESFSSPTDGTLSGSYSYNYDARGQLTSSTSVLLGTTYTTVAAYDDAGEPTTLNYPDGELATTSYSQGWFAGLSWHQGLGIGYAFDTLVGAVSYSGTGGAYGGITSATIGAVSGNALYSYTASYDTLGRAAETTIGKVGGGGSTLFDEQLSYDPNGNVAAVSTTLPAGTDHALFCYDGQNRLKWLGTTTGNPCGNPAPTGSFGSLNYSQAVSYDALDRLTTGPNGGTYSYSDSAHLHAATSTSSGYTASYDASGNMVCRAPTSTTTCTGGSPTGAKLSYDTEGRLSAWQDAYTSPTTTASYLYDGEGQRVAQKVIASGTTTTTSYVGNLETVTVSGSTTTTTNYYYAAGKLVAETVNGTATGLSGLTYLVTNYQGSPTEALDRTGTVTASRLYGPYGSVRYNSGAFPTEYGYTGQRADATTGLDYYGARYYDPVLAQFTSADTVMDGFNRYGYGDGNPTSFTDPSGHLVVDTEMPGLEGGWFARAFGGDGSAMAAAGAMAGAGLASVVGAIGTTTTPVIPLAGTPDPSSTYTINGATVVVTANGDIVVTTKGTGYASSTTMYIPGDAEWATLDHAISQSLADDAPFNARTAPHSSATTSVSTPITGSATTPQAGAGGTGMPSSLGGYPTGAGGTIPTTIPSIGIAVGIGIGITSIDAGGLQTLEDLLGRHFAKKADLKQLRAAARQAGIRDNEDIKEFGDWLEQSEKPKNSRGGKDHYTFGELVELAKEWLELYK